MSNKWGVSVSGSESGVVTGSLSTDDWDYLDTLTNYIVNGGGVTNVVDSNSAFGILTNVSSGISVNVDTIQIDSDANSNDDFEFETVNDIEFT